MAANKIRAITADYETELIAQIPRLRVFVNNLAPGEADDIVQDTLERALRYRASFDGERPAGAWLHKIAFRVFLDHRVSKTRGPDLLGEDVSKIAAPDSTAVDDREQVARLLAGLRTEEKELLIRFHCRGEPLARIAQEIGKPLGTVKSDLHRARRKLARQGKWIEER